MKQKSKTPMPPSLLESLVGYNLKRAYVIIENDFRATLSEFAMSPRVFSALTLIAQVPNLTQSDLSRRLGIERSGLVAIVDELEGNGYVRRVPVPRDRRVQALCPTPDGLTLYREAVRLVRAHEDRVLTMLGTEERAQLIGLLQKIRQCEQGDTA
ncbi:MarR family winged helix-turn-helix transcriptional regulator [Yoonia sp.]|uniref:MarR family winged helix-turn-helix transcriptional regulator n=1 Tax=Yoonia sp. TaxID=2212373 RepID=UPI003F6BD443